MFKTSLEATQFNSSKNQMNTSTFPKMSRNRITHESLLATRLKVWKNEACISKIAV